MFFITGFFIKYFDMTHGQAVGIWIWYGFALITYWYRIYSFINKRGIF